MVSWSDITNFLANIVPTEETYREVSDPNYLLGMVGGGISKAGSRVAPSVLQALRAKLPEEWRGVATMASKEPAGWKKLRAKGSREWKDIQDLKNAIADMFEPEKLIPASGEASPALKARIGQRRAAIDSQYSGKPATPVYPESAGDALSHEIMGTTPEGIDKLRDLASNRPGQFAERKVPFYQRDVRDLVNSGLNKILPVKDFAREQRSLENFVSGGERVASPHAIRDLPRMEPFEQYSQGFPQGIGAYTQGLVGDLWKRAIVPALVASGIGGLLIAQPESLQVPLGHKQTTFGEAFGASEPEAVREWNRGARNEYGLGVSARGRQNPEKIRQQMEYAHAGWRPRRIDPDVLARMIEEENMRALEYFNRDGQQ